jgi:hypothetical protein
MAITAPAKNFLGSLPPHASKFPIAFPSRTDNCRAFSTASSSVSAVTWCVSQPEGVAQLTSMVVAYVRQFENLRQQTVPRLRFLNVIDFAVS